MSKESNNKAVVHLSGSLLRATWHGQEPMPCIVVRPGGDARDTTGYVVNQVRFTGPSQMRFETAPRTSPRAEHDGCVPSQPLMATDHDRFRSWQPARGEAGIVGSLPGFDSAILVYTEADEADIEVQVLPDTPYIPLRDIPRLRDAGEIDLPMIDPQIEVNC
ncbi:hypothetical protein GCM10027168_11830 [Streptomyces capparidis]